VFFLVFFVVVQTDDRTEQLNVLDGLIRLAHVLVTQLGNFHAGFAGEKTLNNMFLLLPIQIRIFKCLLG
jgi:hypothetical protein